MATRPARKAQPAKAQPAPQVVKSQPVAVEVRINGRVRFSNLVYDPELAISDDETQVWLRADLNPTWIDAKPLPPPTRFVDQNDPRDGEKIITRVHSGRRDIIEPAVEAEEP
jgi:hypothetical protein